MKNHTDAIRLVFRALTDGEIGVIGDMEEIDAVGHRVVQAERHYDARFDRYTRSRPR
jgi:acetate kinase